MQTECKDCQLAEIHGIHGIYSLKCIGCRLRLLMDEPCKIIREVLAQGMRKWGELPDYKKDPSCGCKYTCQRRQSTKMLSSDDRYAN